VPPAQRKAEEERRKRDGEDRRKQDEAEERKTRKADEAKQQAADAARAEKERKRREKEEKEEKARLEKEVRERAKKPAAEGEGQCDEASLEEFAEMCEAAVSNTKADIEALAKEALNLFLDQELRTVQPIRRVLLPLLESCRGKEDNAVVAAVARFEPVLSALVEAAYDRNVHRFKVKVLCETQRVAHELGLPRLSPASALLEVVFDGLYQAELIEEGYFTMWRDGDDNTPGKINAMFQLQNFFEWLENGPLEEENSEEEGEEEEEEDEEDDDEEDDEDIAPLR